MLLKYQEKFLLIIISINAVFVCQGYAPIFQISHLGQPVTSLARLWSLVCSLTLLRQTKVCFPSANIRSDHKYYEHSKPTAAKIQGTSRTFFCLVFLCFVPLPTPINLNSLYFLYVTFVCINSLIFHHLT